MKLSFTKPSLPPALQRLAADARQYWERLSPRERRLASLAALVVSAALVYLILVEPAWTRVNTLGEQLPLLRAQAAAIDALTGEARTLQRQASGKMSPEESRQALLDSLQRAGIVATLDSSASDDKLQIHVEQASASSLMQWLASAPAQTRLRLAQATLARPNDGNGRPILGRVSGTLAFAPADGASGKGDNR